ncbi:patatin-like phospholipase family protein [Actinocorallia sp. A-T 12471]|uniref:patatin-like phospholipase family protein n=1 Tax=Actinocorallia sp. A-T 12471 TaxID=3089813 RepID=UPI0029CC452B|nr:patatin-like phospholipase family protein [Actinocorallia sp. A-T 12471]MDX6740839.1 patatin-like phospholipase family protein [Actinocorallia sp. A-T 12471]
MEAELAATHPVVMALAERTRTGSRPGERTDGLRIALAIEGGGMRGTISAGMALALAQAGLTDAFDAIYGASAGAITGAWLLTGTPEQLRGWAEPQYANAMIRFRNAWRGKPIVDVHDLVEHLYVEVAKMDFDAILAHPVTYHPLATDVRTGLATDLHPYLGSPADVRLALRASAALPLLAGPPVALGGRLFYDAGLAESIPYRTALAQGATHVLVLRSRPAGPPPRPRRGPSLGSRLVAATALRHSAELRTAYYSRPSRLAEDTTLLTTHNTTPLTSPHPSVLTVHPAPTAPAVGRLTRSPHLLTAALEAGQAATAPLLALLTPPHP